MRAARSGFTLVEVIVVLLVISVTTAVAVPAFRSRAPVENPLDTAQRRIETLFRLARDSALRGGSPVTVVIDSATSHVWLNARDMAAAASGPEGMPLDLPAGVRIELGAARAHFRFAATGAALGDSLVLRSGGVARLIGLSPWSGDVIAR